MDCFTSLSISLSAHAKKVTPAFFSRPWAAQEIGSGDAVVRSCRRDFRCLRCRNLMPSLWEQIPLPDLHEPETMSILYQGKKSLSSFREDNKKAALSDGRMNMEADLGRNDTEQGKRVTKKQAPSTHWLSAHADKKAPLISAGTNREEICDNRQCTSHELPLVHTSEMTLDYCFFCHDKKHFL